MNSSLTHILIQSTLFTTIYTYTMHFQPQHIQCLHKRNRNLYPMSNNRWLSIMWRNLIYCSTIPDSLHSHILYDILKRYAGSDKVKSLVSIGVLVYKCFDYKRFRTRELMWCGSPNKWGWWVRNVEIVALRRRRDWLTRTRWNVCGT